MEKLIDFYKQILTSMGMTVEEDGSVTHQLTGDTLPLKVKSRPVVLPSRELLASPIKDDRVIFHPLSENVVRGGESEVIKTMRNVVELQTTFYITALMRQLAHFAAGKGPKLNGRQTASLKAIQDADDKFCKFLDNVIDAADVKGQDRIVKFFLARSITLNGKTCTRACVVKFPVLSQASDDRKDKVFGVKIPRKKDRQLLVDLMQLILDGFGLDDEHYSFGSSSSTAPYWDALLGAYLNVSTRINKVVASFGKHIPDVQFVPPMNTKLIDTSEWENEINAMHRLRDTIPPMPYNTGVPEDNKPHREAPVAGVEERTRTEPRSEPAQSSIRSEPGNESPPWEEPAGHEAKENHSIRQAPGPVEQSPYGYSYGAGGAAPAPAADPYSFDALVAQAGRQMQMPAHMGGGYNQQSYGQQGYNQQSYAGSPWGRPYSGWGQ